MIRHPVGLKYFTMALKKEFSEENIDVCAGCIVCLLPMSLLTTVSVCVCAGWGVQFWKRAEEFHAEAEKYDDLPSPPAEIAEVGNPNLVCCVCVAVAQ